jgi:hypothetical protein
MMARTHAWMHAFMATRWLPFQQSLARAHLHAQSMITHLHAFTNVILHAGTIVCKYNPFHSTTRKRTNAIRRQCEAVSSLHASSHERMHARTVDRMNFCTNTPSPAKIQSLLAEQTYGSKHAHSKLACSITNVVITRGTVGRTHVCLNDRTFPPTAN